MTIAELIYDKVKGLPEDRQTEILDFVEFLGEKGEEITDEEWSRFSVASTMRGMESDDGPEYSLDDLKERYE
jgi:hypothetical protein